jgi:hypothetical protein
MIGRRLAALGGEEEQGLGCGLVGGTHPQAAATLQLVRARARRVPRGLDARGRPRGAGPRALGGPGGKAAGLAHARGKGGAGWASWAADAKGEGGGQVGQPRKEGRNGPFPIFSFLFLYLLFFPILSTISNRIFFIKRMLHKITHQTK